MDQLTIDPHVAWALYCIMIAMLVALVLLVDPGSGRRRRTANHLRKEEPRRARRWWDH